MEEQNLEQHYLKDIPDLSSEVVEVLLSQWIETAEQAVSITASEEGGEGLKNILGKTDQDYDAFMACLEEAIGSEKMKRLRQSEKGGSLGVCLTEGQKRKYGIG